MNDFIYPASVIFAQYLRSADQPSKIVCEAEIKLACMDYHLRPYAPPELPTLIRRIRT